MSFLILKAYSMLIVFDLYLATGNFAALYKKIRSYPVNKRSGMKETLDQICAAIDIACIWYWKEALCLQRSASTVCLLRQFGVPAQMVIGARQVPFKAHAWVEVDGAVVNDKPYTPQLYSVLERC
jgi:Transglutaminase-like superfamily